MKIVFKQVGKKSYIYRVSGTKAELAEYCDEQGANLVAEPDGTPLFFLSKNREFVPSNTPIELVEMKDGTLRYMPVDTEQSIMFRQAMEKAVMKNFATPPSQPVDNSTTEDTEDEEEDAELEVAPTPVPRKTKRAPVK